jgi:hypothetical protein
MTEKITNQTDLKDIINGNNISIKFLTSSLNNEDYNSSEINYDNLFWQFQDKYDNFFQLLQKSETELLQLPIVGKSTIDKLKTFLKDNNCYIGMFKDFNIMSFYSLTEQKIRLEDLTPEEKTLSLTVLNCLVKQTSNDTELGKDIRKIFNQIKS